MEIYFNSTEYDRLYSCDYMNQTEWEKYTFPDPLVGALLIGIGTIYFCAYIPCLIVMLKNEFFQNSCFKIMFFHGCIDVCVIICSSFITGYLTIVGTVFCTHPTIQYFTGLFILGAWCAQCLNCIILAFNRCVDFMSPNLSEILFSGKRTFIYWFLVLCYMLCYTIFTKSLTLSAGVNMWLENPYLTVPADVIPVDPADYSNMANVYNNYILIPLMFILYAILIVNIRIKGRGGQTQLQIQLKLLRQAGFICLLNFIPGATFVLVNFIPTPPFVIYICLLSWQCGNGGGGVIILICNKTIRRHVCALIFKGKLKGVSSASVAPGATASQCVRQNTEVSHTMQPEGQSGRGST